MTGRSLRGALGVAVVVCLAAHVGADWTDTTVLTATDYHGPGLKWLGNVHNLDGTSKRQIAMSYIAKSVMTGSDSYFPMTLPAGLRTPFLTPDSTHPNLAFWYTPEAFERDSVADGAEVSEWKNVANICHDGHPAASCTAEKKRQANAFSNNQHVEKLVQADTRWKPVYKRGLLNGHGVVRFTRAHRHGTSGQFLEMVEGCATDTACAATSSTAGFITDWTNSATPANTLFTMFMVVRTHQQRDDANEMGIVRIYPNAATTGFGVFTTATECHPRVSPTLTASSILAEPVTFLASGAGDATPGIYDGLTLKISSTGTADTQTTVVPVEHTCTIAQYMITGTLTSAITGSITAVEIEGGAGATIGKWTYADIATSKPFIKIGGTNVLTTGMTATGANSAHSTLAFGATTFGDYPAGTKVYFGATATEYNLAVLETGSTLCTGTTGAAATESEVVSPTAPTCGTGDYGQFSSVAAYYGGVAGVDAGCSMECSTAGGCDPTTGNFGAANTCVKKWGSARTLQDPNKGFKIVAVQVSNADAKVFVDGIHDGCEGAATCTITPPVDISGATALVMERFRVGQRTDATGFASMDMAEMLIYDKSLTATEMDRVGNYLANKYDIRSFRVNRNVRSLWRSAAVAQSPGCDQILYKPHKANVCGGISVAGITGCVTTISSITLASIADVDTNDYYTGMKLTITGGGASNDGTVVSAKGQSCQISAYTGSTRVATCDLSNHGEFGYVLWGGTVAYPYVDPTITVGAALADVKLMVSWAPKDWTVPYYAAIGDPTATREMVLVTAATFVDDGLAGRYQLTVTRAYAGTTAVDISLANTKARDVVAKITYARTHAVVDVAVADDGIVVNDIHGWTTLPKTGIVNMVHSITGKGTPATHTLAITEMKRIQWTLTAGIDSSVTALSLVANDFVKFDADLLADEDYLRLGDLTSGEVVLVGAATSGLAGSDYPMPTIMRSALSSTAAAWPIGTVVTLIRRGTAVVWALNPIEISGNQILAASVSTLAANIPAFASVAAITAFDGGLVDFKFQPMGDPTATGTEYVGGSGVSTYELATCDVSKTPYVVDTTISVVKDHAFLRSSPTDEEEVPAAVAPNAMFSTPVGTSINGGGTVVELHGWYLTPMDMNLETGSAILGLTGPKAQRNLNYLLVTVGERPFECQDPTRVVPCASPSYPHRETRLTCAIWKTPEGFCANDWNRACSCADTEACPLECEGTTTCLNKPPTGTGHVVEATVRPAIRCEVPGWLDTNSDLNVYWHGVKTTLSHWYAPSEPVVTKVEPSSTPYTGGGMLTIHGANFGPEHAWEGGGKGAIIIEGKSMSGVCLAPRFVGPEMLVCKAAPLSANQHEVDATLMTVDVNVIVATSPGKRSRVNSAGALKFSSVPSYFTCKVSVATQRDKNTCFTCCRSACMVDEVAAGATRGGATFTHCDTACYSYCGFT